MANCTKKTPSLKTTAISSCKRSFTLFRDDQLHHYYLNWNQFFKMDIFSEETGNIFAGNTEVKGRNTESEAT